LISTTSLPLASAAAERQCRQLGDASMKLYKYQVVQAGCAAGVTLSLLLSCSHGYQTLNRSALRASSPRVVRVTTSPSPKFDAQTMKGAFAVAGLIGVAVAAAVEDSDAKKVTRGIVDDPAVFIREVVGVALARRFSLKIRDAAAGVDGYAAGADLLLDIRTLDWGISPTRLGHYGVKYEGTIRLIDLRTKETLAEGICSSHPLDHPDNPTFEQLRANISEPLRDAVQSVAEFCADDYRKRILGLF
jgi:hypothetical protein